MVNSKVFKFTDIKGIITTIAISVAKKHHRKNHPFLPANELSNFFNRLAKIKTKQQNKHALLLLILTALRSRECIDGKWSEIDFKAKIWTIPPTRTKTRVEHIVPLSQAMIEILKRQKKISKDSEYIFPSYKDSNKPMTTTCVRNAIYKARFFRRQNLHGFRHVFSTTCYESGRFRDDAIEMCLSHKIGGVKGVYNKAEYLKERRQIMRWYSAYIMKYAHILLSQA